MGRKKSHKVLIVGDNSQLNKIIAKQETTSPNKTMTVPQCKKALKVAARHPSYFDFLFTDIMTYNASNDDFAQQFAKLSPKTKIVYAIL